MAEASRESLPTALTRHGYQPFGSLHSVCFCHPLVSGPAACQSLGCQLGREISAAPFQHGILNRLQINSVTGTFLFFFLQLIKTEQTKKNNRTNQVVGTTGLGRPPFSVIMEPPLLFHLRTLAISFCPVSKL